MRLLQVCNVGQLVGGTGACVWTVTRALPDVQHSVACLSSISPEMRTGLAGCELYEWQRVTAAEIRRAQPDVVLLHNLSASRCPVRLPVVTVNYLHSQIRPAPADVAVSCSHWLAERLGWAADTVCWQGVPQPPPLSDSMTETRPLRQRLRVGRLCTPLTRKWPDSLIPFYRQLSAEQPHVDWEFVGCPPTLESPLHEACAGQATFWPAGWSARSHFWNWDAVLYQHPEITESFGRVAAEAMRAGCIPIVDDRGGFREQVLPEAGFLCASPAAFGAALAQLANGGERLRRSRACRRIADERFSIAAFRQRLLSVLRTAAERAS